MVFVFALEGCHGVGKTELMKKFSGKYTCLDESFIPTIKTKFNSQSFYQEMCWAIEWFKRLELICSQYFDKKSKIFKTETVIFSDRSPYSSVIYSENGKKMISTIDEIKDEFQKKGIYIYLIHIKDDIEKIWKRVQKRLKVEPWRKTLKENNKEWLKKIYKKYEDFKIWDFEFVDDFEKNITDILLPK